MFITRYQLFRWGLIAFFGGVAFSYLGFYEVRDALILLAVAGALSIFARKNRGILCIGIISLFFFGGVARTLLYEQAHTHAPLQAPFVFSGSVIGQSFLLDGRQHITLRLESGKERGALLRMHIQPQPLYRIDDHVTGTCKTLYTHLNTKSTQIPLKGAPALCRNGVIESVKDSPSFGIRMIRGFKDTIHEAFRRGMPSPESDFLAGLLIGDQDKTSRTLTDIFRRAGISHIVAISGYNIALVIAALWSVLRYTPFGRRKSMWVLVGGTILFVCVTGASPSSVRAAIMGIAVLLAQYLGRSSHTITTLLFTGAVMVVVDPTLLLFNVGFQLSFLATLGLVALVPLLAFEGRIPSLWGLRDIAAQSIAAMIFTEPIILATFHTFSVVGLAANLAILPVIPIIMILGFGWGTLAYVALLFDRLFSFSLDPLVTLLGLPLYGFLTYGVHSASWFAALPFALLQIDTGEWTPLIVCGWYGLLWLVIDTKRRRIHLDPAL